MNLSDPDHSKLFSSSDYDKILKDIYMECAKHITLDNAFIIKNHNRSIGAEPGCVFFETKSTKDSEKVTFFATTMSKTTNKIADKGDGKPEVQQPQI